MPRKGVKSTVIDVGMLIAAEAVKALRKTDQYAAFLDNVTDTIKETIPAEHLEPEIGQIFIDMGTRLRPTDTEGQASAG